MNSTSIVWLNLAESDLKAARILYTCDNFRSSYFLFQQAVEKANKAFGLLTGFIKESELQSKIGHNSLKIHQRIGQIQLDNSIKLKNVLTLYSSKNVSSPLSTESLENSIQHLQEHEKFIEDLKFHDLINIKTRDINELINLINEISNVEIKILEKDPEKLKVIFSEISNWLGSFNTDGSKEAKQEFDLFIGEPNFEDDFYSALNETIPLLIDIAFVNIVLYITAFITFKHISSTRYPDRTYNPLKIYTKRLALVKNQPFFMDALEDSILILKKLTN